MRVRVQNGWLLGAVMLLVLAASGTAMAQTTAPAAAADTKTPPAQAAPAPDPFAFPESDSKTKSLGEEEPAAPDAPAPAAPTPAAPAPAADSHPYPGDAVPAAPDDSGYSSSSDSAAGNPAAGTLPTDTRQKLQLNDAGSTGHIDIARAENDDNVADFYIKDGNYKGAYLRYKDAVTYDPDNADGHFRLAEMARKLGKTDEAVSEYNAALKLDPQGSDVKAARKALAGLQPTAKK